MYKLLYLLYFIKYLNISYIYIKYKRNEVKL